MSSERYYRILERRIIALESLLYFEGKRDQEILNNFLGDEYYSKYNLIKNKIKDPEYKDIYKMIKMGPDEVKNYIDNFQSKTSVKQKTKSSGAKKIYEDDEWAVYRITSYNAAKYYGKGTKWCISGNYNGHEERGEEYFYDYVDRFNLDGGYYFYINKKDSGKKYCVLQDVNGEIQTIWDASDNELGSKNTMGLPEVPGVNLKALSTDDLLLQGVYRGDIDLIKKALSMGANINVKSKYGDTALILAVHDADYEIVEFLIDAGADVNAKDKRGFTALMNAARNDALGIAGLLVDVSEDVNAALKIALENDYDEMAELLVNHGAKSESKIKRNRLNRKY